MNIDLRKKLIDQYKDGYRVVAEALAGATPEDLDELKGDNTFEGGH